MATTSSSNLSTSEKQIGYFENTRNSDNMDIEKAADPPAAIASSPSANCTGTGCPAGARIPDPTGRSTFLALSFLDRFLALWILLSMTLGLILGNFVPNLPNALQKGSFASVSVPIAVGLLVMMYPILCKVRYETLHLVLRERELWVQLGFSVVVNWVVAPLMMVALAWAFLPDDRELREGLVLVGVARCIAMVLIWTELANADLPYCAMLVALNSLLQIALFAPFALLYINVFSPPSTKLVISYSTVATSVAVFLGIPLGLAVVTRLLLFPTLGQKGYDKFMKIIGPFSLLGLLFTIVVLFASQAGNLIKQVVSVVRVAAPLIVYFTLVFAGTWGGCWWMWRKGQRMRSAQGTSESEEGDKDGQGSKQKEVEWGYARSTTQALTAASNNFELAIAVAVAAYGVGSKQALAATVGPLIEVPVLLGLVEVAKWGKKRLGWN
ncbi:sodium bile acid symporter family-domain-containing protein [Kalaharituber pfeilii]|nr:sodium bile acid symporter family-domain-containing protein [Kalaharituber pfeilii]